ncbi:MAG: TonB-dependent receptor, partial [Cyclobacteriaceae bacterium]|nr:TonB-dependent receptor [Cyclobacteriaceae bacterium]
YGSEAIGGAINFITARPSAVPTVKLSVRGSSLGYKRVDFQASNTLGKTGVLVAGYYGNQKDGYMEHSDFNKLAITAKYNYQISENTSLRGSLTHIGYTTDMTGSLDSTNFYGQQFSSVHTFTNREVNATRFLNTLEHNWSDKSKTTATLILRDNTMGQIPSYRVKDDYSKWANPTGDKNLAHGESNENAFRSIGSVIQHSLFFNKKAASMVAGISIDRSPVEYAANYISIYKSDLGIYESYLLTDSVLTDYQLNITNMAGYVQGEFSPIPKLKLSAALRADAFYYDYLNNLSEIAFSGVPDSKDTFSAITPKLGLTYDLGRTSGVYANWGTGFGPPQVSELYRGVKVPVLVPAVFQNLEGGTWASLFNNKAVLDVAVYRLHGLNEIISVKQDDGTVENKNAGETLHYGVEYSLTIQPVDAINFRFSGTNARHIFVDYVEGGADYTDKIMSGAPPFISNSQLVFQPAKIKGFRAEIEWQHVAPYFMDNNNSDKYEGYDLMNFRLNQRFGDFQLWFQVLNATNTIYATTSSKSKWGKSYNMGNPRNFNLGISYKFNKIK